MLPGLLEVAGERNLALLKVHSHPGGYDDFSDLDDESDRLLFSSVYGWMNNEDPHTSAVMLPDGRMFGRAVNAAGTFESLSHISVVGDDLKIWHSANFVTVLQEFTRRHAQAFGRITVEMLARLSVAVVGCSGTGSPVVEQLARLGVGELVLVDPDRVEEKNLNRITNATMDDVQQKRFKVEVMERAVSNMGLGTKIRKFAKNLFDPEVVRTVAESDILFGCMDSIDGRYLLNRLATFYSLPYFDLGVRLEAGEEGAIEQVCGTVHYLQPGQSSLLNRGMFTLEQVRAAGLRRTDPMGYREQLASKYIIGVEEERPAVISLNTLLASLAVNELLVRVHPFRDEPNGEFAVYRISLTQAQLYKEREGEPCRVLSRHVGRGDVRPLLEMPELSDVVEVAA